VTLVRIDFLVGELGANVADEDLNGAAQTAHDLRDVMSGSSDGLVLSSYRGGSRLRDMSTSMDRFKDVAARANMTLDELLDFLDSPAGRRLRKMLSTGLILSVPLVMRLPWLKRTPVGKLIELTGGAALIVKLAEAIRDWERSQTPLATGSAVNVPAGG
jgi:hypothetical protein